MCYFGGRGGLKRPAATVPTTPMTLTAVVPTKAAKTISGNENHNLNPCRVIAVPEKIKYTHKNRMTLWPYFFLRPIRSLSFSTSAIAFS